MKPSIGFALGIVTGCAGLLVAQSLTRSPEPHALPPETEAKRITATPLDEQLAAARKRITELEADAVAAVSPAGDATEIDKPKAAEADKTASFIEMMMSLGDNKSKQAVEKEVARLTDLLGLTANQQAIVRDALNKKVAEQKSAGLRLITGKASIADLLAADEHNFAALDSALAAALDAGQLEAYAAVQEEREVKRIESKTDKELDDLAGAASLSDEQKDAAWQVLADINTGEKPGAIPEGTTSEEFMELIDGSLAKRVDGLTPILSEEQMQVYQGQTEGFRKMVGALLGHATGAEAK